MSTFERGSYQVLMGQLPMPGIVAECGIRSFFQVISLEQLLLSLGFQLDADSVTMVHFSSLARC